MKVKKGISLLLLILVNISILAHNVIPHHHHDDMDMVLCLINTSQQHCCDATHEDAATHDHTGCHDHNCIGDCMLKKTMVRQAGAEHIQLSVPHILLIVHHCCGLNGCTLEEPDIPAFFQQKPYLKSYYTTYVSPTLGLRAPPRISFLG